MITRDSLQVITDDKGREGVYVNGGSHPIGHVMRLEDGYYSYLPINYGGFLSSYNLKLIAELLDDLNKVWDDDVKEYFDSLPPSEMSDDDLLPF